MALKPKPSPELAAVYQSAKNWIDVAALRSQTDAYFALPQRVEQEIKDYRQGRGNLKELRDEIVPALRLLGYINFDGEIRFSLSSERPDCWTRSKDGEVRGLEITIAQARAQRELAREMNETGVGRGFSALQDHEPKTSFDKERVRGRVMYSTDQARQTVKMAIARSLAGKRRPHYSGHDLLIEAPLEYLSKDRWDAVVSDLRSVAKDLPFDKCYIVGGRDSEAWFVLK